MRNHATKTFRTSSAFSRTVLTTLQPIPIEDLKKITTEVRPLPKYPVELTPR